MAAPKLGIRCCTASSFSYAKKKHEKVSIAYIIDWRYSGACHKDSLTFGQDSAEQYSAEHAQRADPSKI